MFIPNIPFIRSPYNYDTSVAGDETAIDCTGAECYVQQSAAEEADINTIVRRFGLTGQLPSNLRAPTFGDFTGIPNDYQSALNAVLNADESFMQMPADVRARFRNNPAEFVEFCSDEKNREEAEKLGLVFPKKVDVNQQVTAPAVLPIADTAKKA